MDRNFVPSNPSQPQDLMPQTPTPTEPGSPSPDAQPQQAVDPNAPLSFVPHEPQAPLGDGRFRIRTNRYGDLEEHELVHLLDSIEDERARARFRESIYISVFFWIAVTWVIFYGPKYLWHAPILINPADAIKQHELTQLNLPMLHQLEAKPVPPPKPLDTKTLKQLREMTRETPQPPAPSPAPTPAAPTPAPVAAQPLPSAPSPRNNSPVVPDAPTPQPNVRLPVTGGGTPGENIQQAVRGARRGNGTQFAASPSNPLGGGVDILSDTQGVDFDPYLKRIIADIKRNWLPLIPAEAEPPISKQGETYIRFVILPDGTIGAMKLDGSTKDVAIDHSCWSAITSEGQFPPLPSQFHGPNLELRIHFLVNKDIGQ
jgi:outer membrane biosynthesis protein TonB